MALIKFLTRIRKTAHKHEHDQEQYTLFCCASHASLTHTDMDKCTVHVSSRVYTIAKWQLFAGSRPNHADLTMKWREFLQFVKINHGKKKSRENWMCFSLFWRRRINNNNNISFTSRCADGQHKIERIPLNFHTKSESFYSTVQELLASWFARKFYLFICVHLIFPAKKKKKLTLFTFIGNQKPWTVCKLNMIEEIFQLYNDRRSARKPIVYVQYVVVFYRLYSVCFVLTAKQWKILGRL